MIQKIFNSILLERKRQDLKWGPQTHWNSIWNSILGEEVGEVAKEVNTQAFDQKDFKIDHLKNELIQVAAVAVAWLEDIEKKERREIEVKGKTI